jgi:hypothetical protein
MNSKKNNLSTETDKNDSLINEEKEMSIMLEVIPGVRFVSLRYNDNGSHRYCNESFAIRKEK